MKKIVYVSIFFLSLLTNASFADSAWKQVGENLFLVLQSKETPLLEVTAKMESANFFEKVETDKFKETETIVRRFFSCEWHVEIKYVGEQDAFPTNAQRFQVVYKDNSLQYIDVRLRSRQKLSSGDTLNPQLIVSNLLYPTERHRLPLYEMTHDELRKKIKKGCDPKNVKHFFGEKGGVDWQFADGKRLSPLEIWRHTNIVFEQSPPIIQKCGYSIFASCEPFD
jgi:hypothetical protein